MRPNTHRLNGVGPAHPALGFPLWFADENGVRLELGLDRGDVNIQAIGEPPETPPGPPFPDDFPDEAFYFYAEAEMTVGGTDGPSRARLILALEAAFGGDGTVVDRRQVVFGRIRVRADDLWPDTDYIALHPYGETPPMRTDERGRLFWTQDLGGGPGEFAPALDGQVAPFLTAVPPPPAGYLGDGATATSVTGSPYDTNLFRLIGPRVGNVGATANSAAVGEISTDLFVVQGKVATVRGVQVDRLGYRRDVAGAVVIDVLASTAPGSTIEASGPDVRTTRLAGAGPHYAARVGCDGLPSTVVLAASDDPPELALTLPVHELVTVTRAEHDPSTGTLTVEAVSGDVQAPPLLTLSGDGIPDTRLVGGTVALPGIAAPPPRVTVTSEPDAEGDRGTGSREVTLAGPASVPVPVTAVIAPVPPVPRGRRVTLDGRGSAAARAFSWQQVSGPPITLDNADTARPSFTAPAGDVVVELAVTGAGMTVMTAATIPVTAPAPAVARAGPDLTAAVGDRIVLDGGTSLNAVTFAWTAPGNPGLVLDDADTVTPSFVLPGGGPVALQLTVSGPVGPDAVDAVVVRPLPEQLTVSGAQFRTGRLSWRISGTVTGTAPDRVTARYRGLEIGSALADATGTWDIRRTVPAGDPLRPPPRGAEVVVTSTRGGDRTEPVIVRD
ncbi:MAG: hypothetical protein L0I76_03550 [Pseudonocardia sp.]|nr:hypothetical protein [Pseudonocardia sp.]